MSIERAILKILFLHNSRLSPSEFKDTIGIRGIRHNPRRVAHRSERILKNSGWCNITGQQIYFGDVSEGDIETLIAYSPEPIIFIPERRTASFMRALRESNKQFSINYILDDPNGLVLPSSRETEGVFFRFFRSERSLVKRLHIDSETRRVIGGGNSLREGDYSFVFYAAGRAQTDRILLAYFLFGKRNY